MIPERIRKQMLQSFEQDKNCYRTQIYGYIKPRPNGEFTLNCYALNHSYRHGIRMTEVNRAWSDRPYYLVKDIWKGFWGQTTVCFDEKQKHPFQEGMWYNGNWSLPHRWDKGDEWFMGYIRYMNLDALQQTKYKYCAYDRYYGSLSLMHYIHLYNQHKEIEFISKAGLPQFVNRTFLEKMDKNKGLRDFFRSHVKEMMQSKVVYSPTDIIRARANGWTLEKAHEKEIIRRRYGWVEKGIDREKLHKYLTENHIDEYDYRHYCEFVKEAKMDILGYGIAFPKDFHEAVKKMQKKIAIAKAREDKERMARLRKVAERVNKLLEKMSNMLAWRVGEYKVIIPQTRQEFEKEGQAMHNCIGGYFDMCADGESACFFLRRNGKRFADVEMNPKNGEVLQCRLNRNEAVDEETMKFAKVVAKKILPAFRKNRKAA